MIAFNFLKYKNAESKKKKKKENPSCIKQRMYFLTRCIIKLHNLLPRDTTGTDNTTSMPEAGRQQPSVHTLLLLPSELCRC